MIAFEAECESGKGVTGENMVSMAMIVLVGFALGMRHATDPDHVVAVTTIVAKQCSARKAGLIGALWGLGHTFTIFAVGAVIILFGVVIPPRLGLSMEFAVACMLILLGVLNLTGLLRRAQEKFLTNSLKSEAGEMFEATSRLNRFRDLGAFHVFRPLLIGIVHGLAGSAAVALLVMTAIRDPWWAIAYLLLFGLGTVAGMIIITVLIAMPILWSHQRFSSWNQGISVFSGLLSIGFGFFLTYQIAIVNGLFSNHPQWTPH
jgi:high-affinity nickel permease